jgi:DNA-binding protein H-NS
MAKLELEKMSDAELGELAAAVAQEQERRQEAARKAALAQIKELAAGLGMTVKELLASQSKGRAGPKGEPKYRNPEQTWTGKGMRPGWFVAAQERGIAREDMLI